MKFYSIYKKNGKEPVFVENAMNFYAFIFNIFWLLYHKFWFLSFVYFAFSIILSSLFPGNILINYIPSIIIAIFAQEIKEWHFKQEGFEFKKIVAGVNQDEAKLRYYDCSV